MTMKVYVLTTALKTYDEVVDIDEVEIFRSLGDAQIRMAEHKEMLLHDDDSWEVFSETDRRFRMTQYDNEFVCYIAEREI